MSEYEKGIIDIKEGGEPEKMLHGEWVRLVERYYAEGGKAECLSMTANSKFGQVASRTYSWKSDNDTETFSDVTWFAKREEGDE